MTRKEYLDYHKKMTEKMREISERKNHDYSGFGDDDPFANFRVVEGAKVASTEQGFLTRMLDKISRINTYTHTNSYKVEDESYEDTLIDLANYAILLAGYIKEKKDAQRKSSGKNTSVSDESNGIYFRSKG